MFILILCMELIVLFFLALSFNPLFMVLLFLVYLGFLGISLVFLLNSYYYTYLICLLFLSGLLIMFMYVCSIISSEKIYLKFSFFFLFSVIFLGFGSVESFMLFESGSCVYFEFFNLFKFFIFSFNIFSVFFVFYLFFCLIVVYEVIKKNKGPLRMMV